MYDLRQLVRNAGSANPRTALAAVRILEDEVEWLLVRAVRLARTHGYDWGRIGRLLGRRRQSVRERFERLAPRYGPLPPHVSERTDLERDESELQQRLADHRRRRQFDSDDPVAW